MLYEFKCGRCGARVTKSFPVAERPESVSAPCAEDDAGDCEFMRVISPVTTTFHFADRRKHERSIDLKKGSYE